MSINIKTKDIITSDVNTITFFDNKESNRLFSTVNVRTAESQVEQAIIDSNEPIPVYETEEVSVLGHRGIWVNKREVEKWNGPSLSEYRYNDEKPVTILKPNNTSIEYTQNVMVKYLRPPTPPPPGDLVIRNETESTTLIPPPQIIREVPERSRTPEPIIM